MKDADPMVILVEGFIVIVSVITWVFIAHLIVEAGASVWQAATWPFVAAVLCFAVGAVAHMILRATKQ